MRKVHFPKIARAIDYTSRLHKTRCGIVVELISVRSANCKNCLRVDKVIEKRNAESVRRYVNAR